MTESGTPTQLAETVFTPTQTKILGILADGDMHQTDDIMRALGYNPTVQSERKTFYEHIFQLNARLKRRGQMVICQYYMRRTYYRHVRHLVS